MPSLHRTRPCTHLGGNGLCHQLRRHLHLPKIDSLETWRLEHPMETRPTAASTGSPHFSSARVENGFFDADDTQTDDVRVVAQNIPA